VLFMTQRCVSSRSCLPKGVAVAFCVVACLTLSPWLAAGADGGADTNPELRQAISRLVSDLADSRQDVRDAARQKLLALRRKDLTILRAVVQQRLPLSPAELEPLRDIVMHVYLSEESYVPDSSAGFVGVIFDPDQHESEFEGGGVEIRHRMPGFCGYRFLEDGDIVLAIGMNPRSLVEVHSHEEIISEVKRYSAGHTILFRLVRRGRILTVPLVLDAKPAVLNGVEALAAFQAERSAQAEGYWDTSFEPLFEPTAQITP
jgi:hypothetical protein